MKHIIDIGDRVKVIFAEDASAGFWGEVAYKPNGVGDSWIIVCDNGDTYAVQQFSYIFKPAEDTHE